MYLAFPIGYMYYFGTNLENRFAVSDFWPTQEQSHKIPYDKDEIRAEIERYQREMKARKSALAAAAAENTAAQAQRADGS
jgi:protein PET100, fungi type